MTIRKLLKGRTGDVRIQLFRYLLTGGAAFVVDAGLLILLAEHGMHYLTAAALSFIAGLAVNYCLSTAWVFRRPDTAPPAAFAVFAAIGVAGLGLNEAIVWAATEMLGIRYPVSKTISAAAVFLWNFAARKYLLFYGKD